MVRQTQQTKKEPAKKPAGKKPAAAAKSAKGTKSTAKATDATAKAPAKKASAGRQKAKTITPEQRRQMIAETAYHIAAGRGFQGDDAMADWLQAETEVDARFAERH